MCYNKDTVKERGIEMNKNVKYKNIRIGKHVFTCHLVKRDGYVTIDVRAWHLPPCNSWEAFCQWWKTKTYITTYWNPDFTKETLEESIVSACEMVVSDLETVSTFDKQWDDIES